MFTTERTWTMMRTIRTSRSVNVSRPSVRWGRETETRVARTGGWGAAFSTVRALVILFTRKALCLIHTELKRDRDKEYWLTVYYAEHFTLQLMWELKRNQELREWVSNPFCTLTGELTGELMVCCTVISMSAWSHLRSHASCSVKCLVKHRSRSRSHISCVWISHQSSLHI